MDPASVGSGALARRMRCERPFNRRTISAAVFLRGNSPKNSSMYWISSAPCSRSYCVMWYSTSALRSLFLLDLRPCVAQRDCPVEHEGSGPGVGIEAEVADALELHVRRRA